MGGPSRESYLAAQGAKRKRLAALRTREGVVDLAEWRAAAKAERWMRERFGTLPALFSVRLAPAEDVGFVLHVTLLGDDSEARMCLPSSVDDVPVRVRIRNARTSPERPCPSPA